MILHQVNFIKMKFIFSLGLGENDLNLINFDDLNLSLTFEMGEAN